MIDPDDLAAAQLADRTIDVATTAAVLAASTFAQYLNAQLDWHEGGVSTGQLMTAIDVAKRQTIAELRPAREENE